MTIELVIISILAIIILFGIGFFCVAAYLTGKEHAQTEKWNNDRNP